MKKASKPQICSRGKTALIVVDVQRDFLFPGGFANARGVPAASINKLRSRVVKPVQRLLEAARRAGLPVIHTREGHRPDLSDLSEKKREAWRKGRKIGDKGPMGRILVRGEYGHDLVDEVKPQKGEIIVDKPENDAFYKTRLEAILRNRGTTHLLLVGVTTPACVLGTVIGAKQRGFHQVVLRDCVGHYSDAERNAALKIIAGQAGLFGIVVTSRQLLKELRRVAA